MLGSSEVIFSAQCGIDLERTLAEVQESGEWHLWLFTAVFLCVAAVIALRALDPGVCWFPEAGWGFSPGTCFEYWLNRYQTLVGAVVAVIAGILAWVAAQRQFSHQRSSDWRRERYRLRQILSVNNSVARSLDDLLDLEQLRTELIGYRFSLQRQQGLLNAHQEELASIKRERSFLRDTYRFVVAGPELEAAINDARDAIREAYVLAKRLRADARATLARDRTIQNGDPVIAAVTALARDCASTRLRLARSIAALQTALQQSIGDMGRKIRRVSRD